MRQGAELGLRRLLLTVSTFVLFVCSLGLCLLQSIPQDPLHLRTTLTAYVILFIIMSIIGLVAATKRNSMLITIFAIHILLDSAILLIPRFLIMRFSLSVPNMICSSSRYPDAIPDLVGASRLSRLENDMLQLSSPRKSVAGCMLWMWGLDLAFLSLMLLQMGAQALLGIRLLGYSNWLARQKRLEKIVDEDTCSA